MLILAIVVALLQVAPLSPEYEKRRALSEAVQGKRPATEAEIQQMLLEAVRDANPIVRRDGVGILATVHYLSSMPAVPPAQEWGLRLRAVAQALQPEVERLLDDTDAGVRREALRAFAAAAATTSPPPGQPLPLPVLRRLAAHFDKYTDSSGRGFIITVIQSSYQSQEPDARAICLTLLRKALRDKDAYVVQAAAHSATRAKAPEALPLLVEQLKNPSYVARMGVAQGIASYGAVARPYLPQLEAALAAETDDITKKTIAGTITVITR